MLELKNINYLVSENNQTKQILKDINLKFEDNKITAITGQNGSGKSTLIKLMMGLISPTSGRVFYNDLDITDLDIASRANNGFTIAFQQPIKFKGLTVKDLMDIASRKNNKIVDACEYLSMVGLCARNYLDRPLDETLSGGELKRIELALSLAKGGQVFLFDEPEAGIDLWSFEELVDIFKKLKNKTIIIVSHQHKILEIADNIILLNSNNSPIQDKAKKLLKQLSNTKQCHKLSGGNNE